MSAGLKPKTKIAVAVSGGGRSLENFLAAEQDVFEVSAVISSNRDSRAELIAKERGLPVFPFEAKKVSASELETWLKARDIDWVALAGFLKIFPSMPSYEGRVVNIHPALLPKFGGHGMYGLRVHKAVLLNEEKVSGATVHFVNERYDEGAIIAQGKVDISDAKSAETIAQRVFDLECSLYPKVVSKLIEGELPLKDGQIWLMKEV